MEKMSGTLDEFSFNQVHNLIESASWMDDIKGHKMTAFNKMHFEDISITRDGKDPLPHDEKAYYAAMTMKKSFDTLMKWDETTRPEPFCFEKATALRFFVHIFGDVHQPLHAATLVSNQFPKGDRGGNSLTVKLAGKKTNLHAVYDQLFRKTKFKSKPFNEDFLKYLVEFGEDLVEAYPEQEEEDLSFLEVCEESNKIAKEQVYPGVEKGDSLSREYVKKGFELCKQRLALAGYRLKNYFIKIYDAYMEKESNLK